jgi:hypothetical protein
MEPTLNSLKDINDAL